MLVGLLLLQFLCALLAEVFIVKEAAVDFLLRHFRAWPEPHTTMEAKLNKVLEESAAAAAAAAALVAAVAVAAPVVPAAGAAVAAATAHPYRPPCCSSRCSSSCCCSTWCCCCCCCICCRQEYTEGGIPSLVVRQELAEARLFAGHEFFICGQSKEANLIRYREIPAAVAAAAPLIAGSKLESRESSLSFSLLANRTLVKVGNGVLAEKGDNADYVVICDESLPEAQRLRRSVSASVSVCLSLSLSLYVSVYVCLSVSLSLSVSVYVCVSLSPSLSCGALAVSVSLFAVSPLSPFVSSLSLVSSLRASCLLLCRSVCESLMGVSVCCWLLLSPGSSPLEMKTSSPPHTDRNMHLS